MTFPFLSGCTLQSPAEKSGEFSLPTLTQKKLIRFDNFLKVVKSKPKTKNKMTFQQQIQQGIPSNLPQPKAFDANINHAPKRKEIKT